MKLVERTEISYLKLNLFGIHYEPAPPEVAPSGDGPIRSLCHHLLRLHQQGYGITEVEVKAPPTFATIKLQVPLKW